MEDCQPSFLCLIKAAHSRPLKLSIKTSSRVSCRLKTGNVILRFGRVLICVVISFVACFASTNESARANESSETEESYFNIPQQDADDALRMFARQAGVGILFPQEMVVSTQTNELKGAHSLDDALSELLGGTRLEGKVSSDGVVVISLSNETGRDNEMNKVTKKTLLATVAAFLLGASASAQDVDTIEDDDASNDANSETDIIISTGTRIRGAETVAPSASFNRDDFDASGFNSIEDLAGSLTQNLGEIAADGLGSAGGSRISNSNVDRTTGISLRGLGPESTLTLVNGRRAPGAINGRVVNIASYPLSVIERVDVVTGGASAVYGSDAVAGVVNLITRTSYDGLELQAFKSFTENGGR